MATVRPEQKIYLDYTQEELDRQYEHRYIVPNLEEFTARAKAASERVRTTLPRMADIPYGPSAEELLDVYPAIEKGRPVVVFFHGGRWEMNSKDDSCEPAESFNRADVNFVCVGFAKITKVSLDEMIRQARAAVVWTYKNAASFGADPDRLFIMGRSSGGQMAGMMVVTDWTEFGLPADTIKGGLLISGMYNLEPVRMTFRNQTLKLEPEGAERNSPIRHLPAKGCPLVVGVGALESDEFRRQSHAFAEAWQKAGFSAEVHDVDGLHHYSMGAAVADHGSPIMKPFLKLLGG